MNNKIIDMGTKTFKFENIMFFLFVIFLAVHFKFFENTYIILKSDYHQRLTSNYGYCEKNSYGFIKYIEDKSLFIFSSVVLWAGPDSSGFCPFLKIRIGSPACPTVDQAFKLENVEPNLIL